MALPAYTTSSEALLLDTLRLEFGHCRTLKHLSQPWFRTARICRSNNRGIRSRVSLFLLDFYGSIQYNSTINLYALSSQGFYGQATLVLSVKINYEPTVHRASYLREV